MFAHNEECEKITTQEKKADIVPFLNQSIINDKSSSSINLNELDSLLEKEKQNNKTEPWNKIDKTIKTQLLHSYAEKYGSEYNLPMKEIKNLKLFFSDCLNRGKIQKNKDVVYNKEIQQIQSIPALFFNNEKKNFTLRILDNRRVSTLKSLTPKKNKIEK